MKGKTQSTEEIIRILRQADGGETAQSVCREHNVSEQTYYLWKKKYGDMEMVSPSQKKFAVAHVVQQRLCSVRRACTYLSLPRSTYRYVPKPVTDHQEQLYQRIIALSRHHSLYGYRRIRVLLAREG